MIELFYLSSQELNKKILETKKKSVIDFDTMAQMLLCRRMYQKRLHDEFELLSTDSVPY